MKLLFNVIILIVCINCGLDIEARTHIFKTNSTDRIMNENNEYTTGAFVASVLLSEVSWDKQQFINDCNIDWDIELDVSDNEDALVSKIGNITIAIGFVPEPVPNKEAEYYAEANYLWPDAAKVTKSQKAHILITVFGDNPDALKKGKLFTKIVSSCLKQNNAIAVYTDCMVFQPEFYQNIAVCMQLEHDSLPIFDWVWFGLSRTKNGVGVYTYGMRKFGKDEMEIYTTNANLNELRNFLYDIVCYVLENDAILIDGETIGFSEDDKYRISFSKGIAVDGYSLKIECPQQ